MTDFVALGGRVNDAEHKLERRRGEARGLAQQGKKAQAEVAMLQDRFQVLEETMAVLNSYADQRQADLQRKVEGLVTHGLRLIFDDQDMEFRLQAGMKGKYAVTDFIVRSKLGDEWVETPVLDARGGGVAAVVGFILRVVMLLLRPGASKVLFLDESFAQLSAEYEPKLAEFLRELCDKTDVQLLLVTHSTAFGDVADVEYRFRLEDGRTVVTREA